MTAVRNEAAKEAEELCALGQFAAALIPLQQAIDMGHLPSRALMAWLFIMGREGIAKNQNRAFQLAKEGVDLGCYHSQGVLAYCYYDGIGCQKDQELSWELARKSSDMGSKYGQLTLGKLYDYRGGHVKDYAQAVAFYRLAVAQGLDEAQYNLGCKYYAGYDQYDFSLVQDMAEVHRLFQLAAAQGYPYALYRLAYYYETGQGVEEDLNEAIRLYMRASAAGMENITETIDRVTRKINRQ
jgi:TPR repeat protein